MYEAFYGLKKKPFSMLPDPEFLFLSKKHQAALTLLEYGMLNHAGFCVISGEPGAGKTTILRALLKNVGDDISVGLITNTHRSFGGLLDWILSAFNLHRPNLTQVEMHQIFMDYLIDEYANNRSILLIVDEAQNMTADALEELRMLSNVNSEKDQLMQIILAGQPALKEMLQLPELMQFAQRIAVDYHLDALSLEETCGYIQHRLRVAGAEKDVFTPAACERIHNYSGGTPRLINLLCETVLVYGFADQLEMIDVDLVDEMVQERMKDSVVPIVNRNIAKQDNKAASEKLEKNFPWIQPKDETGGADLQNTAASDVQQQTIAGDASENYDEVLDAIDEAPLPFENLEDEAEEIFKNEKIVEVNAAAVDDNLQHAINEAELSVSVSKQYREEQYEKAQYQADEYREEQYQETQSSRITDEIDFLAKEEAAEKRATRKRLVKYGVLSAVLGVILIAAAVVLDYENKIKLNILNDHLLGLQGQVQPQNEESRTDTEAAVQAEENKARQAAEAEAARIKAVEAATAKAAAEAEIAEAKAAAAAEIAKAKASAEAEVAKVRAEAAKAQAEAEAAKARAAAEAETARKKAVAEAEAARAKAAREAEIAAKAALLRQQHEAELVKIKEQKRAAEAERFAAEKQAAERAALAIEAEKKKKIAEQQQAARAKAREKERQAKLAAERAAQEKRRAEELERERIFQQARLERQKRLEQEAETRRLEQEWYEKQRQALLEAEAAQLLRLSGESAGQ